MHACLTGGAGYIGSHILVGLLDGGHDVLVVDNCENSSPTCLQHVRQLTGGQFDFLKEDICNRPTLSASLSALSPDIIIHCAGLKAVEESQEQPLRYYRTNVEGLISLLEAMMRQAASASFCHLPPLSMARRVTLPITRRIRWHRSMSMGAPR